MKIRYSVLQVSKDKRIFPLSNQFQNVQMEGFIHDIIIEDRVTLTLKSIQA